MSELLRSSTMTLGNDFERLKLGQAIKNIIPYFLSAIFLSLYRSKLYSSDFQQILESFCTRHLNIVQYFIIQDINDNINEQ